MSETNLIDRPVMQEPVIDFTEDEIVEHVNKYSAIDRRMLPRFGAMQRYGKCTTCGASSGPYIACAKHRERATIFRALKELEADGEILRVTDGRGKKGGSLWKLKPKTPYVRPEQKIGRNEPCKCGSLKKYKHCCFLRHNV